MQSPAPATAAKNFGLPTSQAMVGCCRKPRRDGRGCGETSAAGAGLGSAAFPRSDGKFSSRLWQHRSRPGKRVTSSGDDDSCSCRGPPAGMAPRRCFIGFCNIVAAAAVLGTEVLAGSGGRGTKHTTPCRNRGVSWGGGEKKENWATSLLPSKLVVFRCARGAACPPGGYHSVKASPWKLQLRMPATGPDRSPPGVRAAEGAGQGTGSARVGDFPCYAHGGDGGSSSPVPVRQRRAVLVRAARLCPTEISPSRVISPAKKRPFCSQVPSWHLCPTLRGCPGLCGATSLWLGDPWGPRVGVLSSR